MTAHIVYLLRQHDYVAIPGIGGFVAQYRPAERHPVSHIVSPPGKQLTFNKQLQRNDGLLQQRLIETMSITPEGARGVIDQFATTLRDRLDNREVVKLTGIGKLFVDVEGNTRFVQANDTDLLPESFGLPTLTLHPIVRQKLVDLGPAVPVNTGKKEGFRVGLAVAAMVAVVLSLVTTYFTIPAVQQETNTLFGWDTSLMTGTHSWEESSILPLSDIDLTAFYPITVSVSLETTTVELEATELEQPLTFDANSGMPKGYYIIIGSFNKERNARQLQGQLAADGHDAWQFPATESGFIRVGVFIAGDDLLSANKHMLQLRESLQQDAWILRNQ